MSNSEKTHAGLHSINIEDADTEKLRDLTPLSTVSGKGHPTLLAMSGVFAGRVFPLDHYPLILGRREDCEICIPEPSISRRHVQFDQDDNKSVRIIDLVSTNGTYVNGKRVEHHLLRDGERIQIGLTSVFKFNSPDTFELTFQRDQYEQSIRDDLTQVFNRRHLVNQLRAELGYALRHRIPTSLILFDVDQFKQLNDSLGHEAGNEALIWLAHLISDNLREEDMFARYGGDEFAILLRGEDSKKAHDSAERIRRVVEETRFDWQGEPVSITVSVGVSSRVGTQVYDSRRMIQAADKNLLAAKRAGGNTTVSNLS